ncbi:MAG: class I SAM-dependent methyltransferase [Litorimonas sp.]
MAYSRKVQRELLFKGGWKYLRYLHLHDALERCKHEVASVGVVGAGRGMAEVALALENPDIEFTITDARFEHYPIYDQAMEYAWKLSADNVRFGVWNILEPTHRRFDLICSTEVLEHIPQDREAVARMYDAAEKYVYCIVPFATPESRADEALCASTLERFGHIVPGYDIGTLRALFPGEVHLAGTYFDDAGTVLRQKLGEMSVPEIDQQLDALIDLARLDIRDELPTTEARSQGIKILSRV